MDKMSEIPGTQLGFTPVDYRVLEEGSMNRARDYDQRLPRRLGTVAARFGSGPPGGSAEEEIPPAMQERLTRQEQSGEEDLQNA